MINVSISQIKDANNKYSCFLQIRVPSTAGEIFRGTPSLSLTQTVTPYQFLGSYDIVLQHPESFEVGHFKANIEIKWPFLKLWGCGKTMS